MSKSRKEIIGLLIGIVITPPAILYLLNWVEHIHAPYWYIGVAFAGINFILALCFAANRNLSGIITLSFVYCLTTAATTFVLFIFGSVIGLSTGIIKMGHP